MKAKQLLDNGQLTEAIDQLNSEVRSQPNDLGRRTFLFELLCFAGDLGRAERQLDAISHLDANPMAMLGSQVYRNLLEAEKKRASLFGQGLRPRFMLEPSEAVLLHLEALELSRQGRGQEARARLDQAAEQRPPRPGTLNGVAFDNIQDADDILGPVLEVFAPAGYCWVPWDQIQFLEVPEPKSLRDLLWAPARLASFDGQMGEVFLPNLYPGAHAGTDDAIRLGRKTEWIETDGGIVRGQGQRLLLVGDEARTLLDLRDVQFAPPALNVDQESTPEATEERP